MTKNERREFLKASLASLAGAAGVSIPGCKKPEEGQALPCYYGYDDDLRYEKKDETPPPEPTDPEADKAARREELTKELEELGKTDPGEEFEPLDAMCYDIAMPGDFE